MVKKILFLILLSLTFPFISKAEKLPGNYILELNGTNIMNNNWSYKASGTHYFHFLAQPYTYNTPNIPDKVYGSIVLCSDGPLSNFYTYNSTYGVVNFSTVNSNFKCMYNNSTYTGGTIRIINFDIYPTTFMSQSGYEAFVSFQLTQGSSIQYIDFVVDNEKYVNINNYLDQSIIIIQSETNNLLQQQNNNTNNINNSINDSSIPNNSEISSKFSDFDNFLPTNNTISSLLTMPITLFTNVLNSINANCSLFNLGSLMGTNITLPCINLQSLLGNTLWSLIDVLFSGLFVFVIGKKFIKVFNNFSSLKEKILYC